MNIAELQVFRKMPLFSWFTNDIALKFRLLRNIDICWPPNGCSALPVPNLGIG